MSFLFPIRTIEDRDHSELKNDKMLKKSLQVSPHDFEMDYNMS